MQGTRNLRKGGGVGMPGCCADDCMLMVKKIRRLVSCRLMDAAKTVWREPTWTTLYPVAEAVQNDGHKSAWLHVGPAK